MSDLNYFGGVNTIQPPGHLCLIYDSQADWASTIIPYMMAGYRNGECCFYITDMHAAEEIRTHLRDQGMDVLAAEDSGRLRIVGHHNTFTDRGYFEPDYMIQLLIDDAEQAIAAGCKGMRITAEMSWMKRGYPGWRKIPEYEAKLNRDYLSKYPALMLCQYARHRTDADMLKDVLMTHPYVIRNGKIMRSRYYISPDDYLGFRRSDHEVELWLKNMEQEHESEERIRFLADIVENTTQPFFAVLPSGKMLACNKSYASLARIEESRDKRRQENPIHGWRKILFDGKKQYPQTLRLEKEYTLPDGSMHTGEINIYPSKDGVGKVQYYSVFINDVTDIKKMERERQDREQFLQKLIDTIPNPIYYKNLEGVYLGCNSAMEKIAGVSRNQITGMTAYELVQKHQAEFFAKMDNVLFNMPGVQSYETDIQFQDGVLRDVIFNKATYMDADENPAGIVGMIVDITQRKQMERQIENERQLLYSLMDKLPASVHLQAPDYSVVFANQFFRKRFGEYEGRMCYQIFAERDEPCLKCRSRTIFATYESQEWEWTCNDRVYHCYGYPFEDMDGSPLVLTLGFDITQRKRAMENLMIADKVFNNITAGVMISSKEGIIRSINPAFTHVTGLEAEDLVGSHIFHINKPYFTRERVEEMMASLEQKGWWRSEIEFPRKPEGTILVEISVSSIQNQKGEISQYCSIIKDVSELKQMHEERRRMEEQTARAQRMASLSAMSAGIVHEIAQPLNSIKLLADGGLFWHEQGMDVDLNEMIQSLRDISAEVEQIGKIIDHVRSFAHINSPAAVSLCDINQCIQSVLAVMGRQLAAHGITLIQTLGESLPKILASSSGLEEIILNLIVNAMNALDEVNRSNKVIQIETRAEQGILKLIVEDNATGIKEEIAEKIFEPLFSTKESGQGMGLGLSIIQSIVFRLQGKISVYNNQNGGATFVIELPPVNEEVFDI